jgi:hypothetical protein
MLSQAVKNMEEDEIPEAVKVKTSNKYEKVLAKSAK